MGKEALHLVLEHSHHGVEEGRVSRRGGVPAFNRIYRIYKERKGLM